MRRFVALVVVALLAFTLVGCGGGGGEEAAAPEAAPDAAAPPPAPTGGGEAVSNPVTDRSTEESAVFEPFPAGDFVPDEIAGRLETKQPMLLLFIDDEQASTDDVRAEVKRVIDDNRGLIDLIVYDMGKFVSVRNTTGEIVVDDKLAEDESAKKQAELSVKLGVRFTPYIVIVDDQGYVVFKSRGPIDSDMLERQVARVSR